MALILLIRHAENEYVKEGRLAGRLPEVSLNDKGVEQAKALGEKLRKTKITAIYSSPLERTMETAEQVASSHNLDIIPAPGLVEVNFGDWQGKTLKSLRRRKLWKVVQGSPSQMRFPGGESFAEAQVRIVNTLNEINKNHKPKDILACVSHSDLIKLAIAHYIGLPLDMFQRLHISPGSISVLNVNEMGGHLLSMNVDNPITIARH